MKAFAKAGIWFQGLSVGSLMTSFGFYFVYDKWQPLVWSAGAVAVLQLINHFIMFVDTPERWR